MRIISQDRMIDIPYEKMCVEAQLMNGVKSRIIAYLVENGEDYWELGNYEKERALEVMKEIREHYDKVRRSEIYGCDFVTCTYEMPLE